MTKAMPFLQKAILLSYDPRRLSGGILLCLALYNKSAYNNTMNTALIYSMIINTLALCLMGIDKHRARTRQWRIPERVLFGAALLGGSAGAWAGMYLFHHKTRHWYFVVGMPLILAVQAAAVIYLTH